jgi:integrase
MPRKGHSPEQVLNKLRQVETWHHLSYNAGSYLLSEHVPITAVSKILGHSNPAITMSIYAHELKEDFEQVRVAMAKFA